MIKEFSSAPASDGVFMSRFGFNEIVFQTDIAEFQIFSILHIGFLFFVLEKHAIPIFNGFQHPPSDGSSILPSSLQPPRGTDSAPCGSARKNGWVVKELPTERSSVRTLASARKTAARGEKCAAMTSLG